jgi:hypothetical protein
MLDADGSMDPAEISAFVGVLLAGADFVNGYNVFWRHVLPRMSLTADGFEVETMMNVRALCANLRSTTRTTTSWWSTARRAAAARQR